MNQKNRFIYYDKKMPMLVIGNFAFLFNISRFGVVFNIIRFVKNRTDAKRFFNFGLGVCRVVNRFDYAWDIFFNIGIGDKSIGFTHEIPKRFYKQQREKFWDQKKGIPRYFNSQP